MTPDDQILRAQIIALLRGGNAHMTFDEAAANFPMDHINTKPSQVPYTFWHLLEHLRIAQWDILEFVRHPAYKSPAWPEGYWPAPDATATPDDWQNTIERFRADLDTIQQMVQDPAQSLTAPLAHAPDYTLLREALLVADHNAYHIGELGILRQVMGLWPA